MTLGFYHNQERCIGCGACQVACKDKFDIQAAGPRTRRVDTYESGDFPNCGIFTTSISCNHCDDPACVRVCPTGAMYKRDEDGLVLHDDDRCIGCRSCAMGCPYGAPQYLESKGIVVKCDMCYAIRDQGGMPACVGACSQRALDFGDIDELHSKYGSELVSRCSSLPKSTETNANILIRARKNAIDDSDYHAVIL